MKKELPTIEVPPSGKKSWMGGAYTLAFVFSKKGNFLVKGFMSDIEEYLKKNHTHYLVKFTLWHTKKFGYLPNKHRTIWKFWKDGVRIYEGSGRRKTRKGKVVSERFEIKIFDYNTFKTKKEISFRRPLSRWIPELNEF